MKQKIVRVNVALLMNIFVGDWFIMYFLLQFRRAAKSRLTRLWHWITSIEIERSVGFLTLIFHLLVKRGIWQVLDQKNTKYNNLSQCFSTCGPRPIGGPWSSLWWATKFLLFLFNIKIANTNCINFILKFKLNSYKSIKKIRNEFNLSQFKAWKRPKQVQKVFGGQQKCLN